MTKKPLHTGDYVTRIGLAQPPDPSEYSLSNQIMDKMHTHLLGALGVPTEAFGEPQSSSALTLETIRNAIKRLPQKPPDETYIVSRNNIQHMIEEFGWEMGRVNENHYVYMGRHFYVSPHVGDDKIYGIDVSKVRDGIFRREVKVYSQPIEQLVDDPVLARRILHELQRVWPQLNEKSKIEFTSRPSARIIRPRRLSLWDEMIWVKIKGGQALKFFAFNGHRYYNLDNPDERWEYQQRLWVLIFTAPKYLLWRTLGRLFKRQDWYRRGMLLQPSPYAPAADYDTVEFKDFVFATSVGYQVDWPSYPYTDSQHICCGYYPGNDTLYVYRRG